MTRDEIMKMEPGRELDAIVDNLVLNRYGTTRKHEEWVYPAPRSTDIAAAFEAEEIAIEKDPAMYVHALASVVFGCSQVQDISDIRKMCMLIHATPEQRCKAALLAVMDNETN